MDAAGAVHWPLVFVYPETMQMDAVEDAAEGDTLAAQLDAMFAPGAPPLAWDAAGAYTRARLELFYLSHAARPLSLEHLTEARRRAGCFAVRLACVITLLRKGLALICSCYDLPLLSALATICS
jgi:hypothetical protein